MNGETVLTGVERGRTMVDKLSKTCQLLESFQKMILKKSSGVSTINHFTVVNGPAVL